MKILRVLSRSFALVVLVPAAAVNFLEVYAAVITGAGLPAIFENLVDMSQTIILILISFGVLHIYWKEERLL